MNKRNKQKSGRYEFVNGFIFLGEKDSRQSKYLSIKNKTGVSPDETWNLDISIAKFLVPRLKAFKNMTNGYPMNLSEEYGKNAFNEWIKILDQMIYAFKLIENDKMIYSEDQNKKIEKGLDLFRKYFRDLWW